MALGEPTRMLLLRHGQSRWNAMRRWQGLADTPLTVQGRRQARDAGRTLATHPLLAAHIRNREISTIWSSTLSRASQTAALIADELRIHDVRCDARLAETDAGPWQGLTPTEIEAGWPGYLAAKQRPDGFEDTDAVFTRVHAGLLDISSYAAAQGDPLAIVIMHSGVLRTLLRAAGIAVTAVPNLTGWFVDVDPNAIVPVEAFHPDDGDGSASAPSAVQPPTVNRSTNGETRQRSASPLG